MAAYDVEKMAVLRRERFQSIPLAKVLTPEACGMYKSFATVIERTPSEVSQIPIGAIRERPYWDPKLRRSRKIRFALYKELFRLGILTFRSGIKAKAVFFVVKKERLYYQTHCGWSASQCLPSSAAPFLFGDARHSVRTRHDRFWHGLRRARRGRTMWKLVRC